MSDVSKVMGPSGKPEPNVELKATVNPEEFKKMMQQVQETDADEQKKRKQQEEETDEAPPQPVLEEPEYTEPKEGPSFLDVQKKTTPTYRAQPQAASEGRGYAPASPSIYQPQTNEDDAMAPSSFEPSPSVELPSTSYLNSDRQSRIDPSSSNRIQPPSPSSDKTEHGNKKEKNEVPAKKGVEILPPVPELKQAPTAPLDGVKPAPSLSELIAMIPESPQELPKEGVVSESVSSVQAPLGAILEGKPPEKKLSKEEAAELSLFDPSLSELHSPMIAPPSELGPNDPFSRLPAAIQELFTRMLGVITVMNLTPGVTETTFILNTPQFASSVFFGSQIIIKEFSTAPQVFNIQLNGSQQATTLFQSNLTTLAAAFQEGHSDFKVNRLETGYLQDSETERPLFHRKEGGEGQQEHNSG